MKKMRAEKMISVTAPSFFISENAISIINGRISQIIII